MPKYCFKCTKCGRQISVFLNRADRASPPPEPCVTFGILGRCKFERDYPAEVPAVRGDYKVPIVSTSLAFPAYEIAEHRKRFPGVEVKSDGHTANPVLHSLSQKRQYLKGRKWVDRKSY